MVINNLIPMNVDFALVDRDIVLIPKQRGNLFERKTCRVWEKEEDY
jgi:hypothetical protein